MARRPGNRLIQSDAVSAGRAQARQAEAWAQQEHARRGILPLTSIQPRPGGDSRLLKPDHILNLAESIVAVGLVEPPTVDCRGRLLAGAHRVAALRLLQADTRARVEMWVKLTGAYS
ncbi:MAG: ParB N-terminal domain-containing protein [Candidatus Competibacteraceae bacterium]|nr:ParB N-terminal domain-containing protein [Candidatus Competibacteraceae bacterium]